MENLLLSIDYIIKTRAIAYNKGNRPKLSKSSLADLYFAAEFLISEVKQNGSQQDKQRLDKILADYENHFE